MENLELEKEDEEEMDVDSDQPLRVISKRSMVMKDRTTSLTRSLSLVFG